MEVLSKKMTYAEFMEMEIPDGDTSIYELINGEIFIKSASNTTHQRCSGKLAYEFGSYNRQKKVGEFFTAPYDVYFDEHTAGVQPDLLFVSKERNFIIKEDNGLVGVPDLIVEIVSKGSIDKDRDIKKDVYERFAVKEYWIIDPKHKTVEIYNMKEDRYRLSSFAEETGKIKSNVLPDFELEISSIFE